ncbi:MAG: hypothetical protein EPO41_16215 [Reyranella sp.]|uniref:hypothetical protein n=1 Tax=Reyranella sp. TaxID=1929291 RepID=UPI00121EAC72|nr:hypothetical protein [Reyranella sp.]TAJ91164.1 MAG: hypothetical protein EPO41_16215 [Reyranella sp.]
MGTNSVGAEFGRVEQADWQARDTGWLLDDLLISCKTIDGTKRAIGLSYKSNRQLTRSGFPEDFVELAWGQWLGVDGRKLSRDTDAIVLVTASISGDVLDDWNALLREVLSTTPDRIVARLQTLKVQGAQSSSIQRNILDGFRRPPRYRGESTAEEAVELLHDVRVVVFDYGSPTSLATTAALRDARSLLSSSDATEAFALWQRLIGIADEMRPVGGTLKLEHLLEKLRGEFKLRDHPDYRADIEAIRQRSESVMEDIGNRVARIAHLPRAAISDRVREKLARDKVCILGGESGSGKSALLKELAASFDLTVWFSREDLDCASVIDLQNSMKLQHPLLETLLHAPGSCLVVFDSVEGCSERALKLCALLQAKILELNRAHINVALSLQSDASERVIRVLRSHHVTPGSLFPVQCERPDEKEVHGLLEEFPELQWLARRPELAPVLTNLKVLDWFASSGPHALPEAGQRLTTIGVIDELWARWTEDADDGQARSHFLMELAQIEADTLTYGLARGRIGGERQPILRSLERSGLIRIKDERVYLHHDLLGHWARLKILIGENPTSLTHLLQHALSPLWQPAIRLFGQRLLEGDDASRQRWLRSIEIEVDAPPQSSVTRDLFIDALCLATDAQEFLEGMWRALSHNGGKHLRLLLRRFLAVATVPDPRLAVFSTPEDATRLEHLVRLPNWVYWPPVLTFLHSKKQEVALISPYEAADVCHLWLRTTAALAAQGVEIRWRQEAANLAYTIAREVQGRNLETAYYSEGKDDTVFQALLYAAPLLPVEVSELCLELAGRRPISAQISERVARVSKERAEARRVDAGPPVQPVIPPFLGGRRRSSHWQDGPQRHVLSQFRNACLAGDPFARLARANPEAALEVLLAVCIEEASDEDDFGSSSLPGCGLSYWPEGEPPAYFRGPFLSFLNEAPQEALSFVIRLTNFATHRYTRDKCWMDVTVAGESRRWFGNSNVYRWHHDGPVHSASQVVSALMALEFWLYAKIHQQQSIAHWLTRIINESESLAFAGILMNVGKLAPHLFANVLRPLFSVWYFWSWDFQLATLKSTDSTGPLGYWGHQSRQLFDMAAAFSRLPHRSESLLYPEGPIARSMLGRPEYASLFEDVRSKWEAHLSEDDSKESLRLLIERLRPENYLFEAQGAELVPVSFSWPAEIASKNEASLQRLMEEQNRRLLPFQCRKLLHASGDLTREQTESIWTLLKSLEPHLTESLTDRKGPYWEAIDAVISGIALLIAKSWPWLQDDPTRIAWCRARLEETLNFQTDRFSSEVAIGDQRWDSFAAECGVMLLVTDPSDSLARKLVAAAITAFRYATTGLVMTRIADARANLGTLFPHSIALAARWSAVRQMARYQTVEEAVASRRKLIEQFEAGQLSDAIPELQSLNIELRKTLDEHYEKQYPERRVVREPEEHEEGSGQRRKLRPERLALDEHVIMAAFGWLNLAEATPAENKAWVAILKELLALVLNRLPVIRADSRDRLEGTPSEFDNWTLQMVARSIPSRPDEESRRELWKPIVAHGAFAHRWVEYFFWNWFTTGYAATGSANTFVGIWRPMIDFAISQESWSPSKVAYFDLDAVVVQLLALDARWTRQLTNEEHAAIFRQLEEVYEKAIGYWGATPRIVSHFAAFVVLPGPSELLLPAINWLLPKVERFADYDWKHDVEDSLIEFLSACWAQRRDELAADQKNREAFLKLLAKVTARGSPAAIALSRRIAG